MPGIKRFQDETAVVTGAASGIGRATAIALAQQGANLVLADIQKDRLDEVATQIRSLGGHVGREWSMSPSKAISRISPTSSKARRVERPFSSTTPASRWRAKSSTRRSKISDGLWESTSGAAGRHQGVLAGHDQAKTWSHRQHRQLHGPLPHARHRRLLCHKAALIALSEALRQEVRQHNIGVTAICPGVINTHIVESSRYHEASGGATKESTVAFYRDRGWPPERVARAVIKAIRKNQSIVPVGPEAWAPWYIKRFSQSLYEWGTQLAWRRIRGE